MEKAGGVKLPGIAEDTGFTERTKLFQIYLPLMSAWKGLDGRKHQAYCSSPGLCLESALLLCAQHQQSPQENTVCAVRFPLAHCGGCRF